MGSLTDFIGLNKAFFFGGEVFVYTLVPMKGTKVLSRLRPGERRN